MILRSGARYLSSVSRRWRRKWQDSSVLNSDMSNAPGASSGDDACATTDMPDSVGENPDRPTSVPLWQPELWVQLRGSADWRDLEAGAPYRVSRDAAARIVADAVSNGISSRFLGPVPPSEVAMLGDDAREGLVARGLNARQRAVLELLASDARSHDISSCRIYAHEGVTQFALHLRGRYPYFIGSEYAPEAEAAARIWPVLVVDITRSGFPDESFDFVLSNDVLEHVPNLDAAFKDTARILKPSGRLIATFPFHWRSETTQVHAIVEDGQLKHLFPPEYHGNPVDPDGGSLVFQIPGWDVLARCREAGFRDAWMSFCSSSLAGITARDVSGIFVLEAER